LARRPPDRRFASSSSETFEDDATCDFQSIADCSRSATSASSTETADHDFADAG
jgi:hypothetical protein